jgi:hypothetical protein
MAVKTSEPVFYIFWRYFSTFADPAGKFEKKT